MRLGGESFCSVMVGPGRGQRDLFSADRCSGRRVHRRWKSEGLASDGQRTTYNLQLTSSGRESDDKKKGVAPVTATRGPPQTAQFGATHDPKDGNDMSTSNAHTAGLR